MESACLTCKLWRPFVGAAFNSDCRVCSMFRQGFFAGDGASCVLVELLAAFFCCFSNLRCARRNFAFSFNGFVGSGPTTLNLSWLSILVDSFSTVIEAACEQLGEAIVDSVLIFSIKSPAFSSALGWCKPLILDSLSAPHSVSAVFIDCSLSQWSSLSVDGVRMPFSRNALIFFSTFLWDFDKRNDCASHLLQIMAKFRMSTKSFEMSMKITNKIYSLDRVTGTASGLIVWLVTIETGSTPSTVDEILVVVNSHVVCPHS